MAKQARKQTSGDNIPQKKKKTVSAREKVRKHISDINDVISEDDIRNVTVDKKDEERTIEKKEDMLEENSKMNEGNQKEGKKSITPWDVLDE